MVKAKLNLPTIVSQEIIYWKMNPCAHSLWVWRLKICTTTTTTTPFKLKFATFLSFYLSLTLFYVILFYISYVNIHSLFAEYYDFIRTWNLIKMFQPLLFNFWLSVALNKKFLWYQINYFGLVPLRHLILRSIHSGHRNWKWNNEWKDHTVHLQQRYKKQQNLNNLEAAYFMVNSSAVVKKISVTT